jgi:hypothetical protein
MILGCKKFGYRRSLDRWVGDFITGAMVFGIVLQICSVVPQYVGRCSMAVPQQHATFEHFAQTGAALHPALCKSSMPLCTMLAMLWAILQSGP